jgi:hypothetical protein
LEGDNCDFRGAVEAEGQAYGADAAVDVELHLVEAVVAFGILFAHGRQNERAEEGESDLTAVGVAGEHEVDERAAGVGDDNVGEVGFVCHEEDRAVGLGGESEVEVGVTGTGVVDATEPETGAVALDGEVLVDQDGSAMAGEGFDDQGGVEGDVVVAEDCVAEGCGEGGEDLGAPADCMVAGDESERAVGNEVAGEEDEVGGEGVDLMDDALEEERLGVLVEVDVAELHDAIAMEGVRQIGDGDGAVDDVDLVACELARVESQTGGDGAGTYEEASPGETGRLRRGEAGHRS